MFLLRKPTAEFIEATMRDGRSPLLLLAKPLLRRVQRRFCRQASAAMARLADA